MEQRHVAGDLECTFQSTLKLLVLLGGPDDSLPGSFQHAKICQGGVVLTTQDHFLRVRLGTRAMGALALRLQSHVSRRPNHDVRSLEANAERSQSTRALPSGSRNIACVPLSDSVGGNSKKTSLATSSS